MKCQVKFVVILLVCCAQLARSADATRYLGPLPPPPVPTNDVLPAVGRLPLDPVGPFDFERSAGQDSRRLPIRPAVPSQALDRVPRFAVTTNWGARPAAIQVETNSLSPEAIAASEARRQALRDEDRRLGRCEYQREREVVLQDRAKQLRKGMRPEQVIEVMGSPDSIVVSRRVNEHQLADTSVGLDDLHANAAGAELLFSPHPDYKPRSRRPWTPYWTLCVGFDDRGEVFGWSWRP
jgi:hypothetical protein